MTLFGAYALYSFNKAYSIDQYRPMRLKAALALDRQPVLVEPRLESRPLVVKPVSG